MLTAFLGFWHQYGQPLPGSTPYHEIAPHLVLMVFLHRVVNRGGTLEREYAIGVGRMDLLPALWGGDAGDRTQGLAGWGTGPATASDRVMGRFWTALLERALIHQLAESAA